ncbi:c-type cytochrome [Rhodoferax sp.]|uniref:c-type cytochrome n=1 Tax=Rhodoferax sp. TaxID=50421 RepID=UPI0026177269|nr:c-type cytochrome [Rhodoferax sp.]MDD2926500.1 c-type cytochrome [Rhodoferax sp.]
MSLSSRIFLTAALLGTLVALPCAAQSAKSPEAMEASLRNRLNEAAKDPKLTETLLKSGQKVAAFCANCHGQSGNSTSPDIPNLAGQNPVYLLVQLRKFTDGSRRNEFMEGMIKALSTDEKAGVVLFYNRQQALRHPVTNPTLAAKGKVLFNKNCFRCHGENGLGGENFARIAGQQTTYLQRTLQRYRSGDGVRMDPLMAANTKQLTNEDIDAVVAYVASL